MVFTIPHGPSEEDHTLCVFSNYHSRKVRKYVIDYYFKKTVESLKDGDFEEAAKFGGVLAHYLQDSTCPGHVINNLLVNRLFPPLNGKYWHYHRIIDSWPFDTAKIVVKRRLLGVSVEEAVFNLCAENDKAVSFALSKLCPFILSIQANDREKADAISNEINSKAVQLSVSAWHTAFSVAFGKYVKTETAPLDRISLSDMVPIDELGENYSREKLLKYGIKFHETKYHEADPSRSRISNDPYPFEPVADHAFDGKGNTIPIVLDIHDGGEIVRKTFKKGIASSGCGMLVFEAPGQIYGEFHALAGIHPVSGAGKKACFAVFSEQSGEKACLSGEISSGSPAFEFKIPLSTDCETIALIVTEGTPGTHAVWAEPVLLKRDGCVPH